MINKRFGNAKWPHCVDVQNLGPRVVIHVADGLVRRSDNSGIIERRFKSEVQQGSIDGMAE